MKFLILKNRYWIFPLATILVVIAIGWLLVQIGDQTVDDIKRFFLDPDTHPALFFVTLAILPLLGFPISVFCVLAGAKFGLAGGLAAIGSAMAWHLLASYWLVKTHIKVMLQALLQRNNYNIPRIDADKRIRYAVVFTAIPVIPYAVKNLLLAMSDLRWPYYFLIAWPIQMLYGFPLVALTGAVQEQNLILAMIAGAGVLMASWFCHWARKGFNTGRRLSRSRVR